MKSGNETRDFYWRLVRGMKFCFLLCVMVTLISTIPTTAVAGTPQLRIGSSVGNSVMSPGAMPLQPLPVPFVMFSDGFETFSTKWISVPIAGSHASNLWAGVTSGSSPTVSPLSGTWMAEYYSYVVPAGMSAQLNTKKWICLFKLFYPVRLLQFSMYHDSGYPSSADTVEVYILRLFGNPTHQWDLVGAFPRYASYAGWMNHTIDISNYRFNLVKIGFRGISGYGENMYLDIVTITAM